MWPGGRARCLRLALLLCGVASAAGDVWQLQQQLGHLYEQWLPPAARADAASYTSSDQQPSQDSPLLPSVPLETLQQC